MARDYQINGETLVHVKGAANSKIAKLSELGLAAKEVRIIPRFVHKDILIDDFGPEIPADVMWQLADVKIIMTLIHYDNDILLACIRESMGGGGANAAGVPNDEGILASAGTLLGGHFSLFDRDCHFISLNLRSPVLNKPWHFTAAYLTGPPMDLPLGTEKSMVDLIWRAVPYSADQNRLTALQGETRSENIILWDHVLSID